MNIQGIVDRSSSRAVRLDWIVMKQSCMIPFFSFFICKILDFKQLNVVFILKGRAKLHNNDMNWMTDEVNILFKIDEIYSRPVSSWCIAINYMMWCDEGITWVLCDYGNSHTGLRRVPRVNETVSHWWCFTIQSTLSSRVAEKLGIARMSWPLTWGIKANFQPDIEK